MFTLTIACRSLSLRDVCSTCMEHAPIYAKYYYNVTSVDFQTDIANDYIPYML